MRERERGRAGKRRNQILEDHPSSLFGKLYQGDYLHMYMGVVEERGGFGIRTQGKG